jgi:hypothetical protein
MRHRAKCIHAFWVANDQEVSWERLVEYDEAALMDQEDKYRYGVDCPWLINPRRLSKKSEDDE